MGCDIYWLESLTRFAVNPFTLCSISSLISLTFSIDLPFGSSIPQSTRLGDKTLVKRLKELEKGGILERHAYNEIPPRVEYRLTTKGQELAESVIYLLNWMKKWA